MTNNEGDANDVTHDDDPTQGQNTGWEQAWKQRQDAERAADSNACPRTDKHWHGSGQFGAAPHHRLAHGFPATDSNPELLSELTPFHRDDLHASAITDEVLEEVAAYSWAYGWALCWHDGFEYLDALRLPDRDKRGLYNGKGALAGRQNDFPEPGPQSRQR
jgi:hypothetical protein